MKKNKKFNYYRYFVENALNDYKFKLIFLLLVILNGYVAIDSNSDFGFFEAIYMAYTNPWIIAMVLFIVFLNTINIGILYKKNYSVIIRFNNKKDHICFILKISLLVNSIVILMCLMMSCIGLSLKTGGNFSMPIIKYNINVIYYLPFHLIRFVVFVLLLSMIVYYSWYLLQYVGGIIITIILSLPLIIYPITVVAQKHFILYYGYYLLLPIFDNLSIEIKYTVLQILLLATINVILYNVCIKLKKDIV